VNLGRKLTKNKPITYEEMADFLACFPRKKSTENSRFVNVEAVKDYDLSAKNPNKIKEEIHRFPAEILEDIEMNNEKIESLVAEMRKVSLA
jgi:type I restriction enzyme M protein